MSLITPQTAGAKPPLRQAAGASAVLPVLFILVLLSHLVSSRLLAAHGCASRRMDSWRHLRLASKQRFLKCNCCNSAGATRVCGPGSSRDPKPYSPPALAAAILEPGVGGPPERARSRAGGM